LIRLIAYAGSSLKPLSPALTTPTAAAWALYWLASALLVATTMVAKDRRKTVALLSLFIFALSVALWRPRNEGPEIVMLDVGHGDASFIRMPTGETLLIDGGDDGKYGDCGQEIVAPFLWARGVTRLDAVMVSHNDRDHLGGLSYIVDNFRVGTAILGAVKTDNPLEREFLAQCEARGTRVVRVKRGDTVALGTVEIPILHPTPNLPKDILPNNLSVVAQVPFGDKHFLFTGDLEKDMEPTLDAIALRADVLKVPHHGADTSSTPAFIDAVAPAYATISTGSRGRRVMDQPIINRYTAKGITVLRTDRLGAIQFTLKDGALHIQSERLNRGYPIPKD
jgi:competence protein ComEC